MLPLYKAPSVAPSSLSPLGFTSGAPVVPRLRRPPPRPGRLGRPWRPGAALAAGAAASTAACARRAQAQEPSGVVRDVEYVFVRPEEGEVSEEVLQRVNTVSRAHQGLYAVPEGLADTERAVGAITGALCQFPAEHVFQVVGKTPSPAAREAFLAQVREVVRERTGHAVLPEGLEVRSRMGGRYTSLRLAHFIVAVEEIEEVLKALRELPQVGFPDTKTSVLQVVMCF